MFESLSKTIGLGTSFAFLLALTHEALFLFVIGVDVRIVPYEVSDIVTLSTTMLPSILGFLLSLVVFTLVFKDRNPKYFFPGSMLLLLALYLLGYLGKIAIIMLTLILCVRALWIPDAPESAAKHLKENWALLGVLSIWLVVMNALGDAGMALVSEKHVKIELSGHPDGVYLIRSINRGFIVRDSAKNFIFIDRESIKEFSVSTVRD